MRNGGSDVADMATCELCGFSTRWDKNGPERMARHFAERHPDEQAHGHAGHHFHHEDRPE